MRVLLMDIKTGWGMRIALFIFFFVVSASANQNFDAVHFKREILLQLTPESSVNIDTLCREYGLIVLKRLSERLFLLKTQDAAATLQVSHDLQKNPQVLFAHPNYIKKMYAR